MIENKRFKVILDYSDELGILDTETDDVMVIRVNQNNNTIGFCNSIVNLLNVFDGENKGIQGKVWRLLEFLEVNCGVEPEKIKDWWEEDSV